MKIENSTFDDIPKIFDLYRIATDYMKSKNQVHWPEFEKDLIRKEIKENRQWKIVIDDEIACIWATALNDELIWGSKNEDASIYLHRIATHPSFRGRNLVKEITMWANSHCKKSNLKYIRMDTVGLNQGLINHYGKLGFQFLGTKVLESSDGLPDHYKAGEVCYFQKEVI